MKRFLLSALAAGALFAAAVIAAWLAVSALAGYCSDYGATDSSYSRRASYTPHAASPVRNPSYASNLDSDDWLDDFVCDVRATDVVLALAAFFLVLIGAWQGIQLNRAIVAASEAARAARQSAEASRALLAAARDDLRETGSRASEQGRP
jgi:hypothetical protein